MESSPLGRCWQSGVLSCCPLLHFPLLWHKLCIPKCMLQVKVITCLSISTFIWTEWLDDWRRMWGSLLEGEGYQFEVDLQVIQTLLLLWPQCSDAELCVVFVCSFICGLWMVVGVWLWLWAFLLIYEILQDELNNCGDFSLYSCRYILENGTESPGENLTIDFEDGITVTWVFLH